MTPSLLLTQGLKKVLRVEDKQSLGREIFELLARVQNSEDTPAVVGSPQTVDLSLGISKESRILPSLLPPTSEGLDSSHPKVEENGSLLRNSVLATTTMLSILPKFDIAKSANLSANDKAANAHYRILFLRDDNDASLFQRMTRNLAGQLLTLFEFPISRDTLRIGEVTKKCSTKVTRVSNLYQFEALPFRVLVTTHNFFKFELGLAPTSTPVTAFSPITEDFVGASNRWSRGGDEDLQLELVVKKGQLFRSEVEKDYLAKENILLKKQLKELKKEFRP
ncbi:unnamed protein product [Ilex paraguariensis]|uniref:Uncharacterized protein n=1 Tax=Ilex paraguariensis TaxID=185542 RepID=A0ABC8U4M8_9AQUA